MNHYMRTTILKTAALTILAATIIAMPNLSGAADGNTDTAGSASELPGPTRFSGTIGAVDSKAKTFTVDGKTFTVTGETHMTKAGGLATLADAVAGKPARGTYTKTSDGKLVVTRVRFGEGANSNSGPESKSDKPALTKFYGIISAVDTNAMTFVVDDQTLTVSPSTQMTKNDKQAALADAVVGEPARGSYKKASDGKLEVTKVRFGKKTGGKAGGKHGGKNKKASTGASEGE
jgi:Domain of unknown function (DUF5666)